MTDPEPRTHAIDTVDEGTRRVIAKIGRYVLGRLSPPRRPVQAFHEFNEAQILWWVTKVRNRAAAKYPAVSDQLEKLQDHEVLTIIIDEEPDDKQSDEEPHHA